MILPKPPKLSAFKLSAICCSDCGAAAYYSMTKRSLSPRLLYCVACHEAQLIRDLKAGMSSNERHEIAQLRSDFLEANPSHQTNPERPLKCSPFKSNSSSPPPSPGAQTSLI